MNHLSFLRSVDDGTIANHDLIERATGRFYTGETIGRRLCQVILDRVTDKFAPGSVVRVIDPFAGDGRLVRWLLEGAAARGVRYEWQVELWDVHPSRSARASIASLASTVTWRTVDTFKTTLATRTPFDVVITNPPWDALKPDRRELDRLDAADRHAYVGALSDYADFLRNNYPRAAKAAHFSRWSINLSRIGLEVCVRLLDVGGLCGIVLPASFFADERSVELRKLLLRDGSVLDVAFYPAELKLFGRADVACATAIWESGLATRKISLTRFTSADSSTTQELKLPTAENGFAIAVSFGDQTDKFNDHLMSLPTFRDFETNFGLWAGREMDETRLDDKLSTSGQPFLKGRMVARYSITEQPRACVQGDVYTNERSVPYRRVVWRDVSRPNQRRRMIATMIPEGWVCGNSLGVAHFADADDSRLMMLLGLMSSLPFEYQLRRVLSTGHVSLTALRKVRLPEIQSSPLFDRMRDLVKRALNGSPVEPQIEACAARLYGIGKKDYATVVRAFPKLTQEDQDHLLAAYSGCT